MKYKKYKIYYHYGEHHVIINTDENSFFDIIYDLDNEFTIYKLETDDSIYYNIINYYGDLDTIGKIEIIEQEETKCDI